MAEKGFFEKGFRMKFEHRVRQWALATCLIIAMAKSVVNFIVLGETLQRISHFVLAALSILFLFLFLLGKIGKVSKWIKIVSLVVVAGFFFCEGLWIATATLSSDGVGVSGILSNMSYVLFTVIFAILSGQYIVASLKDGGPEYSPAKYKSDGEKAAEVVSYYNKLGSRLGYRFVMKRSQHFGIYDGEHKTEKLAQDNFNEQFASVLSPKPGSKLLDAGCGQGVVAVYLAKNFDVKVTGVTLVDLEVKKAQKLAAYNSVSDKTNFVTGDYHKLDFDDDTFDCVYAIETLSHAYNIEQALSEIWRVLKPGGRFVAAEYEFDFNADSHSREINEVADYVSKHASIHGIRDFNKGNFVSLLQKNNFLDIKEDDWTKRLASSFNRLRSIGKPFKSVVNALGMQNKYPNVVASSFYADNYERNVFWYKVYTTTKEGKL